jgi:hypothetical protein
VGEGGAIRLPADSRMPEVPGRQPGARPGVGFTSFEWEGATMEELIKQLKEKVGIDQGLAEKISGLLQQNAGKVQELLAGQSRGLSQMLQQEGIAKGVVQKVVAFLKENAGNVQTWLAGGGGGVLSKVKDALGGLMGGKRGG